MRVLLTLALIALAGCTITEPHWCLEMEYGDCTGGRGEPIETMRVVGFPAEGAARGDCARHRRASRGEWWPVANMVVRRVDLHEAHPDRRLALTSETRRPRALIPDLE